jgi:hypothetical protein
MSKSIRKEWELNGTQDYADEVNTYLGWKHTYRKEKLRRSVSG